MSNRMSWYQSNSKNSVKNDNPLVLKSTFQIHGEVEQKKNGDNIEVRDCKKFPMSSGCAITSQQTSFVAMNENRNKLLKLLEKRSNNVDGLAAKVQSINDVFVVKGKEKNGRTSDEEDKKPYFEEPDESVLSHLPLEISESDSEEVEEEERENSEEEYTNINDENYENRYTLDSVCGLNEIKETLFSVLVYPFLYPQFFPRRIRWNHILLYGPPGSGKTMLARALANEINATLHNITSADLLSHWQGQTEKQIRNLFQKVRSNSEPTVLFFDEIDGLFRRRISEENDSTRRIKTELLIHLDDFTADFENHQTFLIGATNCPWEIDSSFMRRFHKKIFVPLPDKKARIDIIKKSFEDIVTDLTDIEWNKVAEKTEGYSGSDLVNVVMASCCERFMEAKKAKYWEVRRDFLIPVNSSSLFSTPMKFEDIHPDKVGVRNIIFVDVMKAITKTSRTVEPEELLKYFEFSKEIKSNKHE